MRTCTLTILFLSAMPCVAVTDLVDISTLIPNIKTDCVYATTRNFTGKKIYSKPGCYLLKPVALNLARVQKELESKGLGLLVWDAYRPLPAQQRLWDAVSDDKKKFVANPKMGGKHTRATTVDLTIVRLADGKLLDMGTGHDDFTDKAYYDCPTISNKAKENRKLLHDVMCKHGFEPIAHEWWHFDYKGWRNYPVLDVEFDSIA